MANLIPKDLEMVRNAVEREGARLFGSDWTGREKYVTCDRRWLERENIDITAEREELRTRWDEARDSLRYAFYEQNEPVWYMKNGEPKSCEISWLSEAGQRVLDNYQDWHFYVPGMDRHGFWPRALLKKPPETEKARQNKTAPVERVFDFLSGYADGAQTRDDCLKAAKAHFEPLNVPVKSVFIPAWDKLPSDKKLPPHRPKTRD